MKLIDLRQEYQQKICKSIIRITSGASQRQGYPNFADGSSKGSVAIAWGIVEKLGCPHKRGRLAGQTIGKLFEELIRDFLRLSFGRLQHLRPGQWSYLIDQTAISNFDQYEHLAHLDEVIGKDKVLATALGGDYIIKPDIVVGRYPVSDDDLNVDMVFLEKGDDIAQFTPLRSMNHNLVRQILHASISCKWTIRSDRSQNTRTEALNLIRNRKGRLPHIVAVTAEPLPTRIASLALGTGDMDCVYHFALYELRDANVKIKNEDQLDMLESMIRGKRLRDISDLPFDLAT